MTGKNREFEPPPRGPSLQRQERWFKSALYVGCLLLLVWLYFSSADSGVRLDRPPVDRAPPSIETTTESQRESVADRRSPPRDVAKRPDTSSDDDSESPPAKAADRNDDRKEVVDRDREDALVVRNVRVVDEDGRVVYRGDIDLRPTLDRIEHGKRLRFSHDGIVFENRERRLPKKPSGYYHEFVQPTPGDNGPGGQRIVIGRGGEVYYSSDHYHTFRRIR